MELEFKTHGNLKQSEAAAAWADNVCTEIVYGGSKGSGKSYLLISLIFAYALMYPGTRYFIARKSLNDLIKHTVPTIHEVFKNWDLGTQYYSFNGTYNYYKLHNGSTVYFLEAKAMPSDPEYMRFGSMQFTAGGIEEAGEFPESAKDNLVISTGRWLNKEFGINAKCLQTCNPTKNYLYREFYKKFKLGMLEPHKRFIQALPTDNKMLQPGYLELLERTLKANAKRRLLKGDWEYDDNPDAIIDFEKIYDIFDGNRLIVPSGRKVLTADLARLGGDRIVRIEWDGFRGFVRSFKKQKLDFTVMEMEKSRAKLSIGKKDVLADEGGLGSGVVDLMGYQGYNAKHTPLPSPEAHFNDKGKKEPENYDMLRSQTGCRSADRINTNGIYLECENPDDAQLIIEELEQVKQLPMGPNLKKCLQPKDLMKVDLGRSPDFWDTIHMREYYELKQKTNYGTLQAFNVPIDMDKIMSLSDRIINLNEFRA